MLGEVFTILNSKTYIINGMKLVLGDTNGVLVDFNINTQSREASGGGN